MPRAVRFCRALGFEVLYGGEMSSFTSFEQGRAISTSSPNLPSGAGPVGGEPATVPRDAEWGEPFFHPIDPEGHEPSFARPLLPVSVQ
jgi:hypothetical protein